MAPLHSIAATPVRADATASAALKASTSRLHGVVESGVDWQTAFSDRRHYASLLRRFRRVVKPADAAIEAVLADQHQLLNSRRTWRWIDQDLQNMGASADEPAEPGLADFSWVDSLAQAAGVLYVLEGSSLGGVILARQARESLGVEAASGGRYFGAYGSESANRWRMTRQWLDDHLVHANDKLQATAAATATFAAFQAQLGGAE